MQHMNNARASFILVVTKWMLLVKSPLGFADCIDQLSTNYTESSDLHVPTPGLQLVTHT